MGKTTSSIIFGLAVLLTACSTQKNRFVNRQYHRLTTAYNVLFNGEEAFNIGKSILDASVEDNFFELLEVEPISLSGENINATTLVPGFDRAEEKAVKAIQKHSMRFEGIQRNDQIDQAYLLLGKARYFDRRFFPALEAFNFLLESYGSQEAYLEGLIWREKTNIRLMNNELAIGNLRPLARNLLTKNKLYGAANATVAQAFINLKAFDSAQYYITEAAHYETDRKLQGRYFFISGQLFEITGQAAAALDAYEWVLSLKKKTERKYWIHAKIKQQLLLAQFDSIDPQTALLTLLRKYDNKPFAHSVYRALGSYYLAQNKDSLARVYFSASQNAPSLDEPTQRANFRDLASFYFSQGAYEKTGAYLDSLIPLLDQTPLTQKRTLRERNNLNGILQQENEIQKTDSLLGLLALSKEEQRYFFETYLEEKKKHVAAIVKNNLESNKKQRLFSSSKGSSFYFYRPNLVAQGKQSFLSSWGNRPNVDNWRLSGRLVMPLEAEQKLEQKGGTKVSIQVEDLSTLMAQLPPVEAMDSLRQRNHQSYLQAGLLYKEQFDNQPLAVQRLDQLLAKNPVEKIAAAAYYHRYRIAENQGDKTGEDFKNTLINNFPNSPYAQLLTNPNFQETADSSSPEKQYQSLIDAYLKQNYSQATILANTLAIVLSATEWAPKIALVQANICGKLEGKAVWKQKLIAVKNNYPQTPTATYVDQLLEQMEKPQPVKKKTLLQYKWILPFALTEVTALEAYKQMVKTAQGSERGLSVSVDAYNATHSFLVVHGFPSLKAASKFQQNIAENAQKEPNAEEMYNFVVLSKEYQEIQLNKTWSASQKTKVQ
ncbi:MAG: hypothetical protein ACON47_00435 [Flavobacteriaceae bacterium]